MATSKLRYVFIGAGAAIVEAHLDALRGLPIEIAGMSDIDTERGSARAAKAKCTFFMDHHEMLRDVGPDVAVICTPHPFHASHARDCMTAGAHVLVEKPMAVDVSDADSMIAVAERTGRLLGVNFQERFRPNVAYAR